jgi:hypothetical protein
MDYQSLGATAAKSESTAPVTHKGRVLQADADFFCYECADLDESVAENFETLKGHLEVKRKMAGAEYINVHVTLGLKGGREQMATVKVYQEDRNKYRDPALKERVRELRIRLGRYKTDNTSPVVNILQEADD